MVNVHFNPESIGPSYLENTDKTYKSLLVDKITAGSLGKNFTMQDHKIIKMARRKQVTDPLQFHWI